MKKIIALALALIMVLSMGVVALAENTDKVIVNRTEAFDKAEADVTLVTEDLGEDEDIAAPGEKFVLKTPYEKRDWKVSYDFTTAKYGFNGASLIASIAAEKNDELSEDAGKPVYELVLTIKENLTSTSAKELAGVVTLTSKTEKDADGKAVKEYILVEGTVNNALEYIEGAKKAADAEDISDVMAKNVVMFAEDGAGYVEFTDDASLYGLVKVEKDEKAQVYFDALTEDENDAIEAYLGEDYEAIVEEIKFAGTGFKNEVAFQYDAWEEDPHFFYAWDGEKFVDLEAKYDADEDVDNYVFTADAKGIIIVTDVEIVAGAADTKNPDTGANDVVGVAAALAVVSLVAAGAVSLKK